MEHRHSTRIPVNFDVLLYHRGIPVMKSITRDVSVSGMFLESGGASFNRHDVLEVEFASPVQSNGRCRVPAMVVRRQGEGIGLELHYESSETREQIRAAMRTDYRDAHGSPNHVV